MPYIKADERSYVRKAGPENEGDLNFLISELVDDFIGTHGLSYKTLNTAIGALECAKLELYRRIAAPYEDEKIVENGEVYRCTEHLKKG